MPGMIKEYDVPVPMRDGVKLMVDVYRPDAPGRYPVLYAIRHAQQGSAAGRKSPRT